MKKMVIFLFIGAMLFTLAGCGGDKNEAANNETMQSADAATDSGSIDDAEASFTWPSEIPADLQNFDGALFSASARDPYSENAWTMYFECRDMQKVDDYINQLTNLGYKQESYSSNNTGLNYFGTNDEVDININYILGGLSKLYISLKSSSTKTTSNGISQNTGTTTSDSAWPLELSAWDVPTIKNATVASSTNISATQSGMTQGVNVVVTLEKLSRTDFEEYIKTLTAKGFAKNNKESFGDTMLVYEKSVTGGIIKITLLYDEDTTSIVVNNSAAAAEKNSAVGGSVKWPDSVKTIPEFTKGSFKETVDMSGGMYALTFIDVKEDDLIWYRDTLKKSGFKHIEDEEDTESYTKTDNSNLYSVGIWLNDGTLQIVLMKSSF